MLCCPRRQRLLASRAATDDRLVDGEHHRDLTSVPRGEVNARQTRVRFEEVLVACCFVVLVPVVVLALGALGSFAYGTDLFVLAVHEVAGAALPVGNKIGQILMVIDLFLIGATLLIAGRLLRAVRRPHGSCGHGRLPEWLEMRDLNDLKARVISMIVLITAVDFVEVLVDSSGGLYILERGDAVALVIAALTAYVRLGRSVHDDGWRRSAQLRGAEMEGPIATARCRGPR